MRNQTGQHSINMDHCLHIKHQHVKRLLLRDGWAAVHMAVHTINRLDSDFVGGAQALFVKVSVNVKRHHLVQPQQRDFGLMHRQLCVGDVRVAFILDNRLTMCTLINVPCTQCSCAGRCQTPSQTWP